MLLLSTSVKLRVAEEMEDGSCAPGDNLSSTHSGMRECITCTKLNSSYTCPRCNGPYCSAACYKKHGAACTESFYREQVEEHVRLTGDHRSVHDTLDAATAAAAFSNTAATGPGIFSWPVPHVGNVGMASRPSQAQAQQQEVGDGQEEGDYANEEDPELQQLVQALHAADLAGELSSLLPPDVHASFQRAVAQGHVADTAAGAALLGWTPWWQASMQEHIKTHKDAASSAAGRGMPVVCLLSAEAGELPTTTQLMRPSQAQAQGGRVVRLEATATAAAAAGVVASTPPQRQPSPLLRFNVVDVLLSYIHVQLLHGGQGRGVGEAGAAGMALVMISGALGRDARHPSVAAAIHDVEAASMQPWLRLEPSMTGPEADVPDHPFPLPALLQGLHAASTGQGAGKASADTIISLRRLSCLCAVLSHPHYVVDALLDCRAILAGAVHELTMSSSAPPSGQKTGGGAGEGRQDRQAQKEDVAQLKAAERKCLFLAAWARDTLLTPDERMSSFDRIAAGVPSGKDVAGSLRREVERLMKDRLQLVGGGGAGTGVRKGTNGALIMPVDR